MPPLNPLHVFAVAATLGSLTRAAKALGVSQSAVSRQVSVLEGHLGTRLVTRERHGIALTPAGRTLHRELAPAFERIAAAAQEARRSARAAPLRLRAYSTFTLKWLLPRMHRFEATHPGVGVRLSHAVSPVDFGREEVDLAIQFGDGRWPGLEAHRIMPDVLQPVCGPRLLGGPAPPLRGPDDLRHHRLLVSHYRRDDWRDWFDWIGRPDLRREGMEFASSVLTYEAASQGLGVAVGQMRLLVDDVEAGVLVPLFGLPFERPLGHYLVWPAAKPPDRRGRAFAQWLKAELAA